MTSTSGYDGGTETEFTLLSYKTKKLDKCIKQWFSDTGNQAAQLSNSWEKRKKQGKPSIYPGCTVARGAQTEHGSLPELKRQS